MDPEPIDLPLDPPDPLPFPARSQRDDTSLQEGQALRAVLTDLTGELWASWRHLPSEIFTDFHARRAWESVRSLPAFTDSGVAGCLDALHFFNHRYDLAFPAGEAPRIFADLLWAWAKREGPRVQAEAGRLLAQGAASGGKPFTIWAPGDFLAWKPDPAANILGHFVRAGELTSFVGLGGLGKSRMALDLAINQILGQPWLDLPVSQTPRRWLFLNVEGGVSRWHADLSKMLSGRSEPSRRLIENHIRALALVPEESGVFTIGEPESMARLAATVKGWRPGVLVLDPLASLIAGDENSAQDMATALSALVSFQRKEIPEAAILLLHHSRSGAANVAMAGDRFQQGNFARGSKALFGRVRAEIQLSPADREDASKLLVTCGKSNDGPPFAPRGVIFDEQSFAYRLDPDFDFEGWKADVAGKRREVSATIEDVVRTVRELAPKPGDEVAFGVLCERVASICGAKARTIQRRAKDAVDLGYLIMPKRGLYRLGSKPFKT